MATLMENCPGASKSKTANKGESKSGKVDAAPEAHQLGKLVHSSLEAVATPGTLTNPIRVDNNEGLGLGRNKFKKQNILDDLNEDRNKFKKAPSNNRMENLKVKIRKGEDYDSYEPSRKKIKLEATNPFRRDDPFPSTSVVKSKATPLLKGIEYAEACGGKGESGPHVFNLVTPPDAFGQDICPKKNCTKNVVLKAHVAEQTDEHAVEQPVRNFICE